MVGFDVYPEPGVFTKILDTTPFVTIAVADAPSPSPPPEIETRGDDVYPEPPFVTTISERDPFTTTLPDAPVPFPPTKSSTGGFAAS